MAAAQRVFYRSPVVRVAFLLSGAFLAIALSPFGPDKWRDTPSLRWLHQVLPWPILAAGWVLYVVLLAYGSLPATIFADWLGLFMYLCGLVALLVTIRTDRPANPFAIAGVFLACVLHYASGRLAMIQAARERLQ